MVIKVTSINSENEKLCVVKKDKLGVVEEKESMCKRVPKRFN